ncbi:hypothetical protein [Desulfosarcina alkanivorans]|uniref:hypothetical protein n=1 Tax=Desulfosarcina alkanivorans TaxID=571177 RepID=UPI0012D32813|nr:hypothetical protein [Desulfosarcina alkanivorans]
MKKMFLLKELLKVPVIILSLSFFTQSGLAGQYSSLGQNHNLHNFRTSVSATKHAYAMGYAFVSEAKIEDSLYENIKLIKNYNVRGAPFRIYKEKATGVLYISYRWFEGSTLNPLAALHGIERTNKRFYKIEEPDFEIITSYAAAIGDLSGLTHHNLTMEDIESKFDTYWPLEDDRWFACNLTANWKSRKVVRQIVSIVIDSFPWETHQGLFIDDFVYNTTAQIYNDNYGGEGTYASWSDGQLDLVSTITKYARNTDFTGQQEPTAIFANIWNPTQSSVLKTKSVWYADNTLRLDHYYYEKGGFQSQAPNGVVPGTNEPAYVDPMNPTGAYIPANKISLDDVYAFNNTLSDRKDNYNKDQHFDQHLDACGTAGLNGAWFGWYGEDGVDLEHQENRIYTNDLQLLRAIPNWDNIAGVDVPDFNAPSSTDERRWNGEEYKSIYSFASADVISSLNPLNNELYIVFRSLDGTVQLPSGKQIETAYFVNELFEKTSENALPAMDMTNGTIQLKTNYINRLHTGIRISFRVNAALNPPSNLLVVDG